MSLVACRSQNATPSHYGEGMFFRDIYPETVKYIASPSHGELARIRKSSHREVRMVCPKGHETVSTFNRIDRILRTGRNFCQHCEYGSIFDALPFLADHYVGDAEPHTLRRMSKVPVRWQDSLGVWEESPYSIYRRREGITPGSLRRSIETFPEAAAMWDDDKPAGSVPPMSHYEAWWRCSDGHRFRRKVYQIARSPNCPVCAGFAVGECGTNSIAAEHPELAARWHPDNPPASEVHARTKQGYFVLLEDGSMSRIFPSEYSKRVRLDGREAVLAEEHSALEAEVRQYVMSLVPAGTQVRANDRAEVPGAGELDIYLPGLRTGIEVNGLHWHSEPRRPDHRYHWNKMQACRTSGVRLIQVWEDDWRGRREIVQQMLAVRLGADTRPSIGARRTDTVEVTHGEAAALLTQHHLQGAATGTFYDGLRGLGGDLVAVMVTKRQGQTYRIDRFATSMRVPGGFGKLLAVLRSRVAAAGGGDITTFSDNEISEGDLYREAGFTRDAELRPDYTYLVGGERRHKFGYRKTRFRSDPELKFKEGLTEKELADLNGLNRVWDSGKVRWRLSVPAA